MIERRGRSCFPSQKACRGVSMIATPPSHLRIKPETLRKPFHRLHAQATAQLYEQGGLNHDMSFFLTAVAFYSLERPDVKVGQNSTGIF